MALALGIVYQVVQAVFSLIVGGAVTFAASRKNEVLLFNTVKRG